jgi:hypothetical protein
MIVCLGPSGQRLSRLGLCWKRSSTPIANAMNFARRTVSTFMRDMARVAAKGDSRLEATMLAAFCIPGVWRLLRPVLNGLDNRPGRLYSFIACKP